MNPFEDTIIDHLNIGVSDAARSKAFYEAALAPLGSTSRFVTRTAVS